MCLAPKKVLFAGMKIPGDEWVTLTGEWRVLAVEPFLKTCNPVSADINFHIVRVQQHHF